jgi:hypothetical protein
MTLGVVRIDLVGPISELRFLAEPSSLSGLQTSSI